MFHKLILTAIVLTAGALPTAGIVGTRLTAQVPPPRPYGQRYYVQFRQPEWREQVFNNRADLDYFVRSQQQNGWDVQVANLPDGTYSVRFRLRQWGGSKLLDTLDEARAWAAQLGTQGYETRIVNYP